MPLTNVKQAHIDVLKAINENTEEGAGAAQEAHNQAVAEAEQQFADLKTTNTELQTANDELSSKVSDLESEMSKKNTEVDDLSKKVSELEKANQKLAEANDTLLKDVVPETPEEENKGIKDSKKRFEKRMAQHS